MVFELSLSLFLTTRYLNFSHPKCASLPKLGDFVNTQHIMQGITCKICNMLLCVSLILGIEVCRYNAQLGSGKTVFADRYRVRIKFICRYYND
jgi:hypothetical protein